MLKKVLCSVLLVSALFGERVLEINLNDQDVEIKFQNPVYVNMNQYSGLESTYYVEAGLLHSSSKQDNDTLYSLGFLLKSEVPSIQNLEAYLGFKLAYSSTTANDTFTAVPIGATLKYKLPLPQGNVGVLGSVYYAPSPLAFSDADGYFEFRGEASFEVIKNSDIFVGFRSIDTDYDTIVGDKKFNESFYIGFRMFI